MGRFDQLEFDDGEPRKKVDKQEKEEHPFLGSTGTPIRDSRYFCREADVQFRLGNLEPALREYSRALEQDSAMFEGWLGQVRVLLETGEYKEADLWANKALELFPEQADLLAVKAIALLRMGNKPAALGMSDRALASKGTTSFVWLARAEVLFASRKPMGDHCLAKAVELDKTGWANWEVSRLLRRYKKTSKAVPFAQEATRLLPAEAGAWLELAHCQLALKNRDAKHSLEQAVELSRDCIVARRLLDRYRTPGLLGLLMFWKE